MAHGFLRSLALAALLGLIVVGSAAAQDCTGTITADEAMKAENARYAALDHQRLRRDAEALRR
jgi:hypothetical protein